MDYRSLDSHIMLQEEVAHPEAATEWWYQNAVFDTSDTPVSDWSMISAFITDRPGMDRLLFLLFPPDREVIDLSCHLEKEKMQAAASGGMFATVTIPLKADIRNMRFLLIEWTLYGEPTI